jgi:hypothetical protein
MLSDGQGISDTLSTSTEKDIYWMGDLGGRKVQSSLVESSRSDRSYTFQKPIPGDDVP